MKRLGVVLVGGMMVLGSGTALPQSSAGTAEGCVTCARWQSYQQIDMRRHEKAFLGSMRHEVDGVVECAIREVAMVKMAQPEWQSARVTVALHSLATGDRSLTIRIKASLAEAVFSEGMEFGEGGYRTDEEVFGAIVQQLQRQRYVAAERAAAAIARSSDK
jgi:hypothetical protein